MCYHYTLVNTEKELIEHYDLGNISVGWEPIFHVNAFNYPKMPVIMDCRPKELSLVSWGLIPFWVKDMESAEILRKRTLNARIETAFEKPSFRDAIKRRRCLVPASGFFEWREFNKKKYPYFISLKEVPIFSFAGIHDSWVDKSTGEIVNTFSICTTEANPLMAKIHNTKLRMPVILHRELEKSWLDASSSKEDILKFSDPFEEQQMKAHTISKLITSRTENSNVPEIMDVVKFDELAEI
ncbi:MAG: SOS response-associated peptidase [Bacteroidetes bacterium]|nr:SOS response-associated peptidase [Bacteroidota bacterium]